MTPSLGPLAAFLTSLPLDFADAVQQATQLGFSHVDVVALFDRPAAHFDALADSGALVQCAALGRDLPPAYGFDVPDVAQRRATLIYVKQQLADAARLGANVVYLVPGFDTSPAARACFTEYCTLLADQASARMMRLCVEHIPGRALPTVAATLDWLEDVAHPNLQLLLDVGHCLLSGEDAVAAVRHAGQRLGYVHLDDNDGIGDVHWPLCTGQLTPRGLQELTAALGDLGYRGGLSLELNPAHGDALKGLRDSKEIVEYLLRG